MTPLTSAMIWFHTNNDDKDGDTHVTVTVRDFRGNMAAQLSNDLGGFPDGSWAGPFPLSILNSVEKSALTWGTCAIRIDPNGHDTWKFNHYLDLVFSDDSHLHSAQDGMTLSQNYRQQQFAITG